MDISQIIVGGLPVEVVRKDIKNLHLGVYPPHGRVRVAAPFAVSNEAIRLAVIGKLGWINRKRRGFEAQERQSRREYVTGESHYFLGRRYRLRVEHAESAPQIRLANKSTLLMRVRPSLDSDQRGQAMNEWYRAYLKATIPNLLEEWTPIIGAAPASWRVQRMKTKWGSCNDRTSHILLNLELAKKPVQCLEYILVHELTHLLERNHNERFIQIMDAVMPLWRLHKQTLNAAPLAHEEWEY